MIEVGQADRHTLPLHFHRARQAAKDLSAFPSDFGIRKSVDRGRRDIQFLSPTAAPVSESLKPPLGCLLVERISVFGQQDQQLQGALRSQVPDLPRQGQRFGGVALLTASLKSSIRAVPFIERMFAFIEADRRKSPAGQAFVGIAEEACRRSPSRFLSSSSRKSS